MGSLLKTDFYALRKSKMTYILLIICAGLALFSVGIFFLLNTVIRAFAEEEGELMGEVGSFLSGRSVMFSNFSLSNNTGIIIPIFAGIFTMGDIRNGTIRNKVIFGRSRTGIYLSHLLISSLLCVTASLVSFLILAAGSTLCFGYGVSFSGAEALNFIRCLVIGILAYLYVASVSTFFAMVTKSTPLTVLLTLAVCVGLGILYSITSLFTPGWYDTLFRLIPTYASSQVSGFGFISGKDFGLGVASFVCFIVLNSVLGIILFKKSDLK